MTAQDLQGQLLDGIKIFTITKEQEQCLTSNLTTGNWKIMTVFAVKVTAKVCHFPFPKRFKGTFDSDMKKCQVDTKVTLA